MRLRVDIMKATSSVASNGIVHELLTKYNYQRWRPVMQKYLQGQGLWEIVKGDSNVETMAQSSQNSTKSKATHDIEQGLPSVSVDEIEDSWKMKDAKALHIILLSCGPEILDKISNSKTAKSAWDYLREQYGVLETKQYNEQVIMGDSDVSNPLSRSLFMMLERGEHTAIWGPAIWTTSANSDRTVLHDAVLVGNLKIVEKLVEEGKEELIGMRDNSGYTALALAARYTGNTDIARCLIESANGTREWLLTMGNDEGDIPVLLAAAHLHKEMTSYLYSKTPHQEVFDQEDSLNRALLLARCIPAQIFGVALKLLIRYPDLLIGSLVLSRWSVEANNSLQKFTEIKGDFSYLDALAKMPFAFPSGCQFGLQKQFIYDILNVEREFMGNYDIPGFPNFVLSVTRVPDGSLRKTSYPSCCWAVRVIGILGLLLRGIAYFFIRIFKCLNIFGIREIYDQKYAHYEVLAVLYCFAQSVAYFDDSQLKDALAYEAMLHAAQNGIVEFINAMMEANSNLLLAVDSQHRDTVTYAILNRKQNVFHALIHHDLSGFNGLQKKIFSYRTDALDNNLLHMAAHLGPSSSTIGAALHMQREIQWFKAVEEVVHPLCKEAKNADGMTPHELFTERHEQLMKDGEKWAKEIATNFTVVGALVTTVMFAAAFTVPGGNNQDTGLPIFLHDKIFTAFLIADMVSLFASVTSIIIFIGILTSRFTGEDFLSGLPRKLLYGIFPLVLSLCFMVVAFCAAHAIILKGYRSYLFAVGPILTLAGIPITYLVISQLRLMFEILISTWKNPISSINKRG